MPPALAAVAFRTTIFRGFRKIEVPGTIVAPAFGNEGVGEHVRTRFHLGGGLPVKLRMLGSAPNEENLFLLPDRISKERTPRNNDPAV
jgi:hypothetical protein